ncbi:ABC transporter ATP-binding protein [Imtechella halotolerans]|uniref:Lipid A export ATP-binding/permease protein n=1 Tax=Imtechella halotolerans K1 TaxID=946077 RepID=I0W9J9_9FLAO|nr:ABC transporter ATP-binding protein [Imtechella halotolerans]EID73065.1 lipid A export ATP-binding/permease protein [Imtechella halotolerans K1]WMQ62162.1 ABC transporter ATP-binding protein [Imtechella halotolerans]
MNYFKKILLFITPYKKYAYLNIFFNVLYALFSALSFVALIPMLNVLFEESERLYTKPVYEGLGGLKDYIGSYLNYQVSMYAGEDEMKALVLVIALVIFLFLLKNIFNYLAMFFITFLRNGVLKDIRNKLYAKITELPISYYSEKRKGDIMARITSDVLEIQHSILSILELIVREPLTIVFTILVMFGISTKLTLFVFIFIPISGIIISRIGKTLKRKSDKVQKESGEFLSIVEETLGGLRIVKAFNAEKLFIDKFQHSTNRFFRFSNSLLNRQNLASPTSEFLGILIIAVLLWFGGSMVLIEKTLNASEFIAYMGLAYNILTPAKAISKAVYGVRKGDAAAARVMEVLETENTIKDSPNAIDKASFESAINLTNVSFKYEDEFVLKNFSLQIPKGKTVALVGQSGSGKSTIANLITRFYDVNEGTIDIDGVNIKQISKTSLRSLMGIVSQDSILFNDTVANNIRLGKPNATEEELIEATQIANAYEFIKELPDEMQTNIGDSGGKLSGGQKQRLSIARAVLKNPPIMILDEATSALDTESEKLVQTALENMMKNRTSIVIAHRLSTIQNADLIVVMQKGEIVEQGTHNELLALKGSYHKLVAMQSFS